MAENTLEFTLGKKIRDNIARVMIGKDRQIELILTALLAEGNILLEDVPGSGQNLTG